MSSNQQVSTASTSTPLASNHSQSASHHSNNLFPCLVCYPGTTNYSLVWLPIDVNSATAATLNPSILNSLMGSSPQTTPQKPHPVSSASPAAVSPPITSSQQSANEQLVAAATCVSTPVTSTAMDSVPSLNSNPLLANNLSAAITQSYLQLLQLQQLQQQALVQQQLAKADPDSVHSTPSLDLSLPSVSSFLPLSSMGGPPADILTQAVSGSIPSTTNSVQQNKSLNLSALAASGAPSSSGL